MTICRAWILVLLLVCQVSATAYDVSVGSLVTVTQTAAINVQAFSLGCWIRIVSTEFGFASVAVKTDESSEGWEFYWNDGGDQLTVNQFNAGADGIWAVTWAGNVGNWTFLSMSYDGASSANDPTIYINGVSQSVSELAAPAAAMVAGTSNLIFLQSASAGGRWTGQQGECSYYNRTLTAAEHQSLYSCGPLSVPRGLVDYWPFGAFGARSYTSGGHEGTPTSVTAIANGPPLQYGQGTPCE